MTQRRELRNEDFELGTGLADDFDGTVIDAYFAPPRQEYRDKAGGGGDEPFLHLKIESPELDQPIEQAWSTGAARQWKAQRDGKEIISQKNADYKNFVSGSRAGELVSRIILGAGGGDKAKGVGVIKDRGYLMTEAEFYMGLQAHWEQVPLPTVGGDTRNVLIPTVVYGFGEAAALPEASAATYTDEDIGKLVTLASGKNENQVKQQIMRSDDLKSNKDLLNAVFNKGLLKELEEAGKLTRDPSGVFI